MLWRSFLALVVVTAFQLASTHGQNKRQSGSPWVPQADVVFVLDSSDTVGSANWEILKTMLVSLVHNWNIGPNRMQVGVVSYGDGAHNELNLDETTSRSELDGRLNAITFHGGAATAAEAFRYAYTTSFSTAHGMRADVPHIIVHISNGPSTNGDLLAYEAQNARDQGITVLNIGVGQGVGTDFLSLVASDPSSRYMLQADSYSSLFNLVPTLSSRIQNEIPQTAQALPSPTGCLTQADLVLVLDSSSSVGEVDFQRLEGFVKDLVRQLPVSQDQVHIGLVQFSGHPSLEFPLDMYTDPLAIMKAVENLQFMGGGTNTGDAIRYVTDNVFTEKAGARYNVPRIAIVITDGNSVLPAETLQAADEARQENIGLIAVGVGSSVNLQELQNIANDPDASHVFQATSYEQLQALTTSVLQSACTLNSQLTPTPPGAITTADPCHDVIDDCDSYQDSVCTEQSYAAWAQENCARRCGFCQPQAGSVVCEDQRNDCSSYGVDMCTNTREWALANCPRYCGLCEKGAATLGFYGKCMYKGREYIQSEKWVDGCDYECVCEDASVGFYRCYNRCPVYHDLPTTCTLIAVPGECCLKPVCNFNQQLTVQELAPGPSTNPQGINVCEYKGRQYFLGQTWEDGCNLKCVCTDVTRGAYQCQSYCPTYGTLPSSCQLVQKPGSCCQEPVCEFNTQTGSFTGFGTLSGRGVETSLGSQVCDDALVDCAHYGSDVCTGFPDWARVNCAQFCGFCSLHAATPGPNDACLYNGHQYRQGQIWQDGCGMECACENAVYGYYRCYNRCPSYLNLPTGCTTVRQAGQCCPSVECQAGTYYPSSTNINTVGNGAGLSVLAPGGGYVEAVPTVPSGSTLAPGTSGGSAGLQEIRLDGCLFHGRVYIQDQQWEEGCNLTCTCEDAVLGRYACRERCPRYENVPSTCIIVPDPNDVCCTKPSCPLSIATSYVAIPIYGQSMQGIGAVMSPSITDLITGLYTTRFHFVYSGFTVAPPTQPLDTLRPGGLDYCEYKGHRYSHGQTWEDGCDYNCVCEDASTGTWRCIEKCEKYIELPPDYCHLEQDPYNTCCMRPVCNFLAIHGEIQGNNTLTTTPVPTPPPTHATCVYKGSSYEKGQFWYDGCELRCSCDDADKNIYTCVSRCPSYPINFDECPSVQDPKDPDCCMIPMCTPTQAPYITPYPGATPAPTPYQVPIFPPGIVTGSSNTPGYCVYKGIQYAQGVTWQDGCQFNCVCDNANTGGYTCTEKCEKYGPMPASCRLISNFANPCCQIPTCSGNTGDIYASGLPPGVTPTPAPACVWNNAQYYQGQTWMDGCSRTCRCEDAVNRLYTCTDRCVRYDSALLPPGCKMVANPTDPCCLVPQCSPLLPPLGSTVAPVPGLIPTLAPGIITGSVPTPSPAPGVSAPPINYCVYKAEAYLQGQQWQDGCDYTCVCIDSTSGRYECTELCTRYTVIPQGCMLIRDAANPCCERPVCSPDLITPSPLPGTLVPGFATTLAPGLGVGTTLAPGLGVGTTLAPGLGSTPAPGFGTTVAPPLGTTQPTLVPTFITAMCEYKGQLYTQSQKWYDGCDYSCTCEDAVRGIYSCIERCPAMPPLPAGCSVGPDPEDPLCCKRPICNFVPQPGQETGFLIPTIPPVVINGGSVIPTPRPLLEPTPGPDGSTLAPPLGTTPAPPAVCVYKTAEYGQGQKWADGCDYNCECVDALSGRFTCIEKCTKYAAIPAQCVMVRDPTNPCCMIPYCDVNMPTPVPLATQSPSLGPTLAPLVGPDGSTVIPTIRTTLSPTPDTCVYNGAYFTTGQSWNDGCDFRCVCENGPLNMYSCNQRCPSYNISPDCKLETDPRDPCCQMPVCFPTQSPTLEPGTLNPITPLPVSTEVPPTGPDGSTLFPPMHPTMSPTLNPEVVPNQVPTAEPGRLVGQQVIGGNNTSFNNSQTNMNPTELQKLCFYQENVYHGGDTWEIGCDYLCKCTDELQGLYICEERCPRYINVPTNCMKMVDPNDQCCEIPNCPEIYNPMFPYATPTPRPSITPAPGATTLVPPKAGESTLAPGPGATTLEPPLAGESTLAPGPGIVPTPNGQTTLTPLPMDMCIYNNLYYLQGQQWYDGCSKVCVCDDASTNYYRCSDRCAKYPDVPSYCQMVASPDDPYCCKVPQCVPTPGPNGYPTPEPGVTPTPMLFTNPPGIITGVAPTPTTAIPGQTPVPRTGCMYNGREYRQGVQWQDGCNYNCICINEVTGEYRCTERCSTYPVIPSQCTLIPDSSDFCCKKLFCDPTASTPDPFAIPTPSPTAVPNPNLHTTLTPVPGVATTLAPPIGGLPTPIYQPPTLAPQFTFCMYNGVPYRQGETWNIGCEKMCTCDDSTRNYYTCSNRCPSYANLGSGCKMVVSLKDPCCSVPECYATPTLAPGATPPSDPNLTPTSVPVPIPIGVPGTIIGQQPSTSNQVSTDGCIRNGVQYKVGDSWQEGCQYNCVCLDQTGKYQCTERCDTYPSMPLGCIMIPNPYDSCCSIPSCQFPVGVPQPPSTIAPPLGGSTLTPVPGLTLAPPYGVSTQEPPLGPTLAPSPGGPTLAPSPGGPTLAPQPGDTVVPPQSVSTLAPYPTLPVSPLPKEVCVFNGQMYTEGQQWFYGCAQVCICEDGKTGFYRCSDRCAQFTNPDSCKLVPDPQDPACCMKPQCEITPDNLKNITGIYGTIDGNGKPPTPSPAPMDSTPAPPLGPTAIPTLPPPFIFPTPALRDVCVYNGREYTQGQRWQDGCSYNCECIDAVQGNYRCTDRCPRYPQNIAIYCVMERDLQDPCCMTPKCDENPTPVPEFTLAPNTQSTLVPIPGFTLTPIPGSTLAPDMTVAPNPQATAFPTLHPTVFPGLQFCVYNGVPYSHAQMWYDGCSKICRCEDVVTGLVNCDERCSKYPEIPAGCRMMTDPKDPCCQVPQCDATNVSPNVTVLHGVPGVITGQSLPSPDPLSRNNLCIYHGHTYNQGDVWDDGCTYTCECIDGMLGKYVCVEKCARYPRVPSNCMMIPDPDNACCQKPFCSPLPLNLVPTPHPIAVPTSSSTIGPNPQDTLSPNPLVTDVPTPGPIAGPTIAPEQMCVFGNELYRQDQLWYSGCDAICRCENAATGFYRCDERCKRYDAPNCMMIPDPADPSCCEIPLCLFATPTPAPGVTPTPGFIRQTGRPGEVFGVGNVPTPMPTQVPTRGPDGLFHTPTPLYGPDGSTITPSPSKGCFYKGVIYRTSESWTDGCEYDCVCLDDTTGQYKCTEKCPVMPQIPQQCVLVQDPLEPCCMQPYCDFVNPIPFPNGYPTPFPMLTPSPMPFMPTTRVPPYGQSNTGNETTFTGSCVYNGVYYRQDQVWYDGCSLECKCDNAITGFITCTDRCKSFDQQPEGCTLKVDPLDSCCLVPDCIPPSLLTPRPPTGIDFTGTPPGVNPGTTYETIIGTGTPGPSYLLTGSRPGTITGVGQIGQPTGTFGLGTGYSNACVYKGVPYGQGQIWEDACNYICTCIDAMRGMYQCTERCSNYYFLPPICVMEPNPNDVCCPIARCYPSGITPTPLYTVSGHTISGPSGTGPTDVIVSITDGFTGSGTPLIISPGMITGPSGTGGIPPTPDTITGTFTGSGTQIIITGAPPTGPSGTGVPLSPETHTDSFTGSGPPIIITGAPPTGPSGTGVPLSPETHTGSFTGTGPPIIITGVPPIGTGGTRTPIPITQGSVTGSTARCIYKEQLYSQGETWQDGCGLTCTCEDAVEGRVVCQYNCLAYSDLPPFCQLVPDPANQCCEKPECTYQGTQLTPVLGGIPTVSPTLTPGLQNYVPIGTHNVTFGSGFPMNPESGSGLIYGGHSACVYKGVVHIPGESWDDGCDYTCTCEGGLNGLYRCVAKCPVYPPLPEYCSLNAIPDRCCPSLSCNIPNIGSYNPIPQLEPEAVPTPGPDGIYPTPMPTANPQLILIPGAHTSTGGNLPGGGAPVSTYLNNTGGIRDKCIYDNRMYNQGETWNIGCEQTCKCMDSRSGYYQCTGRCPQYELPSNCTLVIDPHDSCCTTPSCPDNNGEITTDIIQIQTIYPVVGTFSGGSSGFRPGFLTQGSSNITGGVRNGCVYKGHLYSAGAVWDDGCQFHCMCLDASTGIYQCSAKCPTYTSLPPICREVSVENECCKKIECGIHTPSGCRDKIDNCVQYGRDACFEPYESWARENCPAFCEYCQSDITTTPKPCEDKIDNCQAYGLSACGGDYYMWALDNCIKFCDLCDLTTPTTIYDDATTTRPLTDCYDENAFCVQYGTDVCHNPDYHAWAYDNCRKFCAFCGTTEITTPVPCEDKLTNCELYGQSSCGGIYLGWATDNCRKFCGLCDGASISTHSTTTSVSSCRDRLDNCVAYGISVCTDPLYVAWASDNCMAFCNLCPSGGITTPRMVVDPGWILLMKGVSGVPGDLYQLWSNTALTANPNVAAAQSLTDDFLGHYKPEIANYWQMCSFDRIKVSIWNDGVEKANIIFDVRTSDRTNWFRPENIISSTYETLPQSATDFDMAGTHGREFQVGTFHGQCAGEAWMYVSTQDHCQHESGGTFPRFFYSLSPSSTPLGISTFGEGDVFAILADGGDIRCGSAITVEPFTSRSEYCVYNDNIYEQGDTWVDGCQYNCTCADASTGKYQCINRCPVYTNMPQGCSLVDVPGECCPRLDCLSTDPGCYYKSAIYHEGVTWQDGCDYDCTCTDGASGAYHCTTICQTWDLPSVCTMSPPPPGKCCQVPNCPSYIIIDNPNPR